MNLETLTTEIEATIASENAQPVPAPETPPATNAVDAAIDAVLASIAPLAKVLTVLVAAIDAALASIAPLAKVLTVLVAVGLTALPAMASDLSTGLPRCRSNGGNGSAPTRGCKDGKRPPVCTQDTPKCLLVGK